jgi:hypothetical protein
MFRGELVTKVENHITKRKTSAPSILNRARIKLEKASLTKAGVKSKRNYLNRTYFGRFVLRKRTRFKRTLRFPPGRFVDFDTETQNYRRKVSIARARNPIYKIFAKKGRLHPIRPFTFGLVTAIYRKRNFCAAVHTIDPSKTPSTRLLFKSSVGLTGYAGPKRGTNLGRQRVGKAISHFLRKTKFSLLDLVFPRRLSRRFSFFFRGLLTKRFWLRRILFSKRRSHGFTRLRKARRK